MKNAPPSAQWLIWLSILAVVTVVVAAIDYYAYGFVTHFKGVPADPVAFLTDPDQLLASISTFPQFILTFVFLWIFCVVLFHLIFSHELTATLRWATLTYIVITLLILAASRISSTLDNGFDEARLTNLLNGSDLRGSGDALNGGAPEIDVKAATAWQLTDKPGVKPSPGELKAVTEYLTTHKDASAIKIEKIYHAYYVSPQVIRMLVKHPMTPQGVWNTLAENAANRLGIFYYPGSNPIITAIVRDPRTQPNHLINFLQMPGIDLEKDVMSNSKMTDEFKQIYATVIQPLRQAQTPARLAAAQDPQSAPYILYGLAWDSDPAVRIAVSNNAATPPLTLQRLAYDKDPQVKQAARAIIQSKPFVPTK